MRKESFGPGCCSAQIGARLAVRRPVWIISISLGNRLATLLRKGARLRISIIKPPFRKGNSCTEYPLLEERASGESVMPADHIQICFLVEENKAENTQHPLFNFQAVSGVRFGELADHVDFDSSREIASGHKL